MLDLKKLDKQTHGLRVKLEQLPPIALKTKTKALITLENPHPKILENKISAKFPAATAEELIEHKNFIIIEF